MSTPFMPAALRGSLCALLLAGLWMAQTAAAAKPYEETMPKRGFHLLTRPRQKNPADQWRYVQAMEQAGKLRAATRQALALRLFWPHSPEAPAAQMLHARLLERRGRLEDAFEAYQHLVLHYPGRFEFNEVIGRQLEIARNLMERRKGKFLFIPGFTAPERAIPLFEQIVASAPEWPEAAEAYYLIGQANERVYEYAKAIDAYFTTLHRFPQSEFAERAALGQVHCHIQLAKDAPEDNRALEMAHAACDLFLLRFPQSAHRAEIQETRRSLRRQQAENVLARARYYDRILRNPTSATIEYQAFLDAYPDTEHTAAVRQRMDELAAVMENPK